ncbi:MAG: hypothetical protein AAF622_11375, partial [Cyanobacteria bacterium P01_C01_bin.147]
MMNSPPPADSNMPDPDRPEVSTSSLADGNLSNAALGAQPALAPQKLWVFGNTLGFAIVTAILFRMVIELSAAPGVAGGGETLHTSALIVGSGLGTLQALILKRQVPRLRIWQWVLASILGGYLGMVLWGIVMFILISIPIGSVFGKVIIVALLSATLLGGTLGASIALAQVVVLSRHVRGLRRWWWANVVGRSLGWLSAVFVRQLSTAIQIFAPFDSSLGPSILTLLFWGGIGGLVY